MGRSSSFSSWSSAPEVPSLAEPRLRERSATPEDADMADCSPITPTAAPSHAATSPLLAAAAATPAAAETDAAAAPAAAEAAAQRAASAAALWRRIQSFMHCVSGSPLVHSALLSLQLSGAFPAAAEEGLAAERGLEWTLSQMLSFHLKAGWAEGESRSCCCYCCCFWQYQPSRLAHGVCWLGRFFLCAAAAALIREVFG